MSAGLHLLPIFALAWNTGNRLLYLAIGAVVGIIFLWAGFIRKPRRERRYKYHRAPRQQPVAPKTAKRKRRSEPPMNPTLAETRGLPPVRESEGMIDYQS